MVEDATLIAVVSAITGCVIKGIDVACAYFKAKMDENKDEKGEKSLDSKIDDLTDSSQKITEILLKSDQDGILLTYVPRKLITQLEECGESLRCLRHDSAALPRTLEKLTTTLEAMTLILIRLEDRTSHNKQG